jgi:hypothetical protein
MKYMLIVWPSSKMTLCHREAYCTLWRDEIEQSACAKCTLMRPVVIKNKVKKAIFVHPNLEAILT